jgi:hypothetical protein
MSGVAERVRHCPEEDVVTLTAALSSELADSPCSVADCLEFAQAMGSATVRVVAEVAVPPDFATVTFGLPLCIDHAHLLHGGCTLTDFTSGI